MINKKTISRTLKVKFISIQFYTVLYLLVGTSSLSAQIDSLTAASTSGNVELVSRYIWRGQDIGHAPSIQPGLSATWKDYTLGVWGAYKLNGEGEQETDFYLSKIIGPITIAIWDYWSFNDTTDIDFFNYDKSNTTHILEAQVLLSGGETLPFNLLGSYFFYGADPSNSIYVELQYLPKLGQTDIVFFTGYQLKGDYYASKTALVNLGCTIKYVQLNNCFSFPVSFSLIVNPDRKSVYLVASISL